MSFFVLPRCAPFLLFLLCLTPVVPASGPSKNYYARRFGKTGCKHPFFGKDDIKDSSFAATSYYGKEFQAHAARIMDDHYNDMTAWCPRDMVGSDLREYLQVTLPTTRVITVIQTAGRFAQNTGKEFTPFFQIRYQREESDTWITYKNLNKATILKGNDNPSSPNVLTLMPYIIAKRLRIYPYTGENNRIQVCLKLELYGCAFKDGVVEYMIPQGDKSGDNWNYEDHTYDGHQASLGGDMLTGGMGQLMDNIFFRFNAQGDPYQSKKVGYHFVGWKRSNRLADRPITLIFRFDAVRRFHGCRIHAANRYGKGIRIFRKANLRFSIGGRFFLKKFEVEKKYARDDSLQTSRWVSIQLNDNVGKWVKMELYFDDEWMLLSEIEFFSDIVKNPPPPEVEPTETTAIAFPKTNNVVPQPSGGTKVDTIDPNQSGGIGLPPYMQGQPPPPKSHPPPQVEQPWNNLKHILIIVVAIVGVLILSGFIVFLFVYTCRKQRKKKDEPCYGLAANSAHIPGVDLPLVVMPHNRSQAFPGTLNGKAFNDSSIYTSLPSEDEEEQSERAGAAGSDATYATTGPPPPPPMGGAACTTGVEYASASIFGSPPPPYSSSAYAPAGVVIPGPKGSAMQIIPNPTAVLLENSYNMSLGASPYKISKPPPPATSPPLPQYPPELSIQGVSGNTVYAAPKDLDLSVLDPSVSLDELGLTAVDRADLNFVDHLGGGQFGEVHLAEWCPKTPEGVTEAENVGAGEDGVARVAVKMLRTDASDQARKDFETEIRILSRLKHPNIVGVIGLSNQGGNLLVLVEYMEFGDLHQYLRERYPMDGHHALTSANNKKALSYGALIYIAVQVASAMKYLESLSMVHRDLACRNCLVGQRLTIKISDFGMSRRLYASDYYRIEGKAILPIRWMAWESLLHGIFTPKSDVWSFGVTLWEILTYCQQQPYASLTDEEVIRNCGHMHAEDGEAEYLPYPNCPKEIYDLMCACWNKNDASRPAFREIHLFLQKNNLGFKPEDYCASLA